MQAQFFDPYPLPYKMKTQHCKKKIITLFYIFIIKV